MPFEDEIAGETAPWAMVALAVGAAGWCLWQAIEYQLTSHIERSCEGDGSSRDLYSRAWRSLLQQLQLASCRRKTVEWHSGGRCTGVGIEVKAHSANRDNQARMLPIFLDLLADPPYMNEEGFRILGSVVSPKV